ncbi:MAG: M67 family metallopeptidase [Chitinispirillales bacterium]|nr:M67 family metallopeptidase [Chitinispirillales bacterium]
MLVLSPQEEKSIRTAGENAYPNECCGVMIGEIDKAGVKTVKCVQAIENSWEDGEQYHRFLITPEDIMRAEQTARSMKLDVVGFYHSHPDCEAVPSEYDKDHALPFYSYVIVSVKQRKSEDLNSWELTLNRAEFLREELGA